MSFSQSNADYGKIYRLTFLAQSPVIDLSCSMRLYATVVANRIEHPALWSTGFQLESLPSYFLEWQWLAVATIVSTFVLMWSYMVVNGVMVDDGSRSPNPFDLADRYICPMANNYARSMSYNTMPRSLGFILSTNKLHLLCIKIYIYISDVADTGCVKNITPQLLTVIIHPTKECNERFPVSFKH